MKWPRAQTLLAAFCLGLTLFFSHVSQRLYAYSKRSLGFGEAPEPASFSQLFRYATYLDTPSSANACINRLRQMDGAKQQWALEHPNNFNQDTQLTWKDIDPYVYHGPDGKL